MSKDGLIKTGITGLDDILLGGIPRTNVVLLQGVTGSGKTLMGLEVICFPASEVLAMSEARPGGTWWRLPGKRAALCYAWTARLPRLRLFITGYRS